ncbi:MAG: electron transfer flavoprotein subunit alpha/FixB family protein, partial [Xanthomonadales bacterium]|nr:electron transfer flavoprotein subunit alpha/FixB family protein [Xanthomonadales bacterium]
MSKILIIAEHDSNTLNPSTAKCVSCAAAIGGDCDVLVLGSGIGDVSRQAAALEGVSIVIETDAAHLAHPLAANLAPEVAAAAGAYSHVLGPSTTFGRDLVPRVAALLGVNQVSDIMAVEGPTTFRRPIYAGNAIVKVDVPAETTVVGTVRAASWKEAATGGSASIESRPASSEAASHSRYVSLEAGDGERPDLQ